MLTSPNQGAISEPGKPEAHTEADSQQAEMGGLSKMPYAALPWQLRARKAGSLLQKKKKTPVAGCVVQKCGGLCGF